MADITKCTNGGCPLASRCYRRTAPESRWQSWSSFSCRVTPQGPECDNFIETVTTVTTNCTLEAK